MNWESKNTVFHGLIELDNVIHLLGELEHSLPWTGRVRTQSSLYWESKNTVIHELGELEHCHPLLGELEHSHPWTVRVRTPSSMDL